MDRRDFFKATGALSFAVVVAGDGLRLVTEAQAQEKGKAINAWVRIAPDGTVTILTAGAEMGQGSMTSLPLIVAEEMDADWSKVVLDWAPADPKIYGYPLGERRSMSIVGSRAVQTYYNDLRVAGAQVRKVLLANAAEKWSTDVKTLRTEPGFVVDGAGRKLGYGEIAAFAKVPQPLPAVDAAELKKNGEFRLIGKPVARRDVPAKVNGEAKYGIDVQLPGMVYASTRHCPEHGGEPESWNDAKVRSMSGVLGTVRLPDGVAVVADSIPHALAGRLALQVKWRRGATAGFDSETALEQTYAKVHADPAAKIEVLDSKGDAKSAFASAAKTVRAEFRSDYGYHAQMEPLNAVARFNAAGDRVEIWEGTQDPGTSRLAVAKTLGFNAEQVEFHQCYMGGGFGRRTLGDYASEAARIAREVKKPVKLVWPREEDLQYGMFRPQAFQCLEAALDQEGKVAGWSHCVVGAGGGLLHTGVKIPYYGVPNQHIEMRGAPNGVRVKQWRAVGHVFNVFAIESFVDQLAADAGMDPIAFRLERMRATPKTRAVLEKVAQMCDWNTPRPAGRALGLSLSDRSGSQAAGVAEVSLDRSSGKIRVHKAWLAVDGGTVVQPEMARANVESGIVYGLSSVLHERVTLKGGEVQQSNFHDYHVLRMSDVPEVMEVAFLAKDTKPTGLGEIGNPWVAAAVANAVYRLTGKRLTHMPFTPERVKGLLTA
ncbi:MAG TPA: molybdopterin cofactor-binding domain-containing protein [Burkholderiales bacterium]